MLLAERTSAGVFPQVLKVPRFILLAPLEKAQVGVRRASVGDLGTHRCQLDFRSMALSLTFKALLG